MKILDKHSRKTKTIILNKRHINQVVHNMSNDQKSSQPQNQPSQPHFIQLMSQMQTHQHSILQTMRHPGIVMPMMFVPFQSFSMSPLIFHAVSPFQTEMEMEAKSNGLDPTELARLPTWKHKSTKPKTEPEKEPDCSICLSDFEAEQNISTIPCFHLFHTSCLKPWLENHRECPSCKHEVHLM